MNNVHVKRIFQELRKAENKRNQDDIFQPNRRRPSVPVYVDNNIIIPKTNAQEKVANYQSEKDFDSDDSQADKDYVPKEDSSDSSDTNTISLMKIDKIKRKLFNDSEEKISLKKKKDKSLLKKKQLNKKENVQRLNIDVNNASKEINNNINKPKSSRKNKSKKRTPLDTNSASAYKNQKKQEHDHTKHEDDNLITLEDLLGDANKPENFIDAIELGTEDGVIFEQNEFQACSFSNPPVDSACQKTPVKAVMHSVENVNVVVVERATLSAANSPERDMYNNSDGTEAEKEVQMSISDIQTQTRPLAESSTKKQPKKRIRNEDNWKKVKAKKAKLAGSPYVSVSKTQKTMEAKKIKESCSCRAKCYEKITPEQRKEIFEHYWKVCKNWEQRRQFIANRVIRKIKERSKVNRVLEEERRKYTYTYTFQMELVPISVCKVMFLNTLDVGEKFVKLCVEKKMNSGLIRPDKRGKHRPGNKTDDKIVQSVVDHISSYPSYESHYSRNKSCKRYLGPELNLSIMYKQYEETMREKNVPTVCIAKDWLYRDIFNKKFNLAFKLPGLDTCDDCDRYSRLLKESELSATEKDQYLKQRDDHLKAAEQRYALKKLDKEQTLGSKNKRVLLLDLQKCFPTPSLTNTQSFYLRKLWTLNLTIHDATTKASYNLMWPENIAGRGGNEISSCILYWASKNFTSPELEEITVWTDNCTGQNRNIIVVLAYMWIMHKYPHIKCINHKFLLKGHTHMECDHIHAMIERKKKKLKTMEIASPHDWVQFVKTCSGKNPFHVQEMTLDDMKNFTGLSGKMGPLVQRKKNTSGDSFKISDTVWWQIRSEAPGSLFYKTSFDEETFKQLNLNRNIKNPKKYTDSLPNIRNTEKPISSAKYKDIMTLLQWIPREFHEFYKNLPHDNTASEVPEIEPMDDA